MKSKDIITIKKVLDILNTTYPPAKDIPSNIDYKDVKVDEPEYFTAKYSIYLDKWWIHCINYLVFSDKEFCDFFKVLKEAALLEDVGIMICYVYYGAIQSIKEKKLKGEIFIGNVNSKNKLC